MKLVDALTIDNLSKVQSGQLGLEAFKALTGFSATSGVYGMDFL